MLDVDKMTTTLHNFGDYMSSRPSGTCRSIKPTLSFFRPLRHHMLLTKSLPIKSISLPSLLSCLTAGPVTLYCQVMVLSDKVWQLSGLFSPTYTVRLCLFFISYAV